MAEPEIITEPVEEWRPVVGYEGLYEVSSLGRVRRARRGKSTYIGKILNPGFTQDGYMQVGLHSNSKRWNGRVARLVGLAFLDGYRPGLVINHKNGIKTDNTPGNLEWVTDSENLKHAIHNGLRPWPRGQQNGRHKLTDDDIPAIRKLLAQGLSQQKIADMFGVNQTLISFIKLKRNWTHVQ